MKILVSPAKTLDWESELPTKKHTNSAFPETTAQLSRKLERLSKDELSDLMGISQKLTDLNFERFKEFEEKHTTKNSRPAVYTFDGDVYNGLQAYDIPAEKIDFLQNTLRILSGLYGVLKPLDLMQAYRLEMGTKIGIENADTLYEVWREKITAYLNEEMTDDELLINLASKEYFKAVDHKKLNNRLISPVFKDFKNGKLKIIAFYAKKARGAMTRYIIDKEATSLEDLKGFDYMDYRFSEEYTEKENEPVFIR